MKGSGGTEGGLIMFGGGFLLSAVAIYFFLDSVVATTTDVGLFSGLIRGRRGLQDVGHMGRGYTTSMGIIFVPFVIGVISLFYDAAKAWAWGLTYVGIGIIVVEILSHLRFNLAMKTSSLMIMMVMFAAGVGMMLRSYRDYGNVLESIEREQEE